MKTLKAILALGLVAALFAGCSKNANNTNSTTTTTTTNNTTPKVSTPAAPPAMTGTPATTATPISSIPPAGNTAGQSSPSGTGETFTHPDAGIQFTLPAGWKTKEEGEKIIATSEHEAISVVVWVPQGDNFEQATEELKEQLRQIIKNPQVTTPGQEGTHNGMRAYTAAGKGEVNGQPILWEVDILQSKKPFFVVTFAAPDMFKMHQGDYQQLLASLKPVQ